MQWTRDGDDWIADGGEVGIDDAGEWYGEAYTHDGVFIGQGYPTDVEARRAVELFHAGNHSVLTRLGAKVEVPDMVRPRALTAADRCDRCGAQAYVLTDHDLLFCAHHATEHGDKIADHIVVDERSQLTTSPTSH